MASKPLKQNEKPTAAANDPAAAEGEGDKLAPTGAAARVIGDGPTSAPPPSDDDEDDEFEVEPALEDDDDEEDLVVFTA